MSYVPILRLISKFLSENKEGFHGASLWWELNLIMEVTKGDDGDMKGFIEEERVHSPKTYFPCQQTSWAARPKLQVLCKISYTN